MTDTVSCCFCDRPIERGGRNCNNPYPVKRKSDFCCERCNNIIVYTMQRYLGEFMPKNENKSDYDRLLDDEQAQQLEKELTLACRRIYNMERRQAELNLIGDTPDDEPMDSVKCCFCDRSIPKGDGNSAWPIHDGNEVCCALCNEVIVRFVRDRIHTHDGKSAYDCYLDDEHIQELCGLLKYACRRVYLLESAQRHKS